MAISPLTRLRRHEGQRAVDFADLQTSLKLDASTDFAIDAVIALETYFYLICNLIACASFHDDPAAYLRHIRTLSPKQFLTFLTQLVDGSLLEDHGIFGCRFAFDFDWVVHGNTNQSVTELRDALSELSEIWDQDHLRIPGHDPLQIIHHSLFPKNLLHITGQFYTPEWLAELLLNDVEWTPDKRILDPFCGSEFSWFKPLSGQKLFGAVVSDVLPNLLGIDLNPIACSAARANSCPTTLGGRSKTSRCYSSQYTQRRFSRSSYNKGQNQSSPLRLWSASVKY